MPGDTRTDLLYRYAVIAWLQYFFKNDPVPPKSKMLSAQQEYTLQPSVVHGDYKVGLSVLDSSVCVCARTRVFMERRSIL